ncbi:MAG: hypothetical protein PHV20_10410 [Bacteroidales bacterium]|nr:hypothetical protein [Bacteroidales bacterium]
MIIDVDSKQFRHKLPTDPHPFISEKFTEINAHKVDRIVRLIQDVDKVPLGLIAGIRNNELLSPFSAPFGGFHYKNELVHPSTIDSFLEDLIEYSKQHKLEKLHFILPPDIYSQTLNAKLVNAFVRKGFELEIPEITSWVNLKNFNSTYTYPDSRTYLNQAVKSGLIFRQVDSLQDKQSVYDLIVDNRVRMGRPIFMSFDDLQQAELLFQTDYFAVEGPENDLVSAAIFYRIREKIAFAVFWGDALSGRSVRAMDFLAIHLWNFYKNLGFDYVDLGKSTENGVPNEGLLRFKETHECVSSLKYSITMNL